MKHKSRCFLTLAIIAAIFLGDGSVIAGTPPRAASFGTPIRIGFQAGDDWEPALATDQMGHLYAVYAHADPTSQVYQTRMMVQVSIDGGQTWNAPVPIAPAPPPKSQGQFDPWIAFGPDGRTVSVVLLQGYPQATIQLVTSKDFGATWSTPKSVTALPPPLDKLVLLARGKTMAVAFTDYKVNTWAAISQDAGAHWTTHLIERVGMPNQLLTAGGGIDSLGNIYFAWNGVYLNQPVPTAPVWVTKSSDGGATWSHTDVGVSGLPMACPKCQDHQYFAAQMALQIGSDDHIYLLWNSTPDQTDFASERVYFARSTDHGATYSPRRDISDAPAGIEHCFPTLITGSAPGDLRIAWMDQRNGPWNVFYRTSTDGGDTFAPSIRLSGYVPGYNYLTPDGFAFPYGDYFQLAVDPAGRTHAAFGEARNITKPGNIWIANQQ
jgi:hypothetical protein